MEWGHADSHPDQTIRISRLDHLDAGGRNPARRAGHRGCRGRDGDAGQPRARGRGGPADPEFAAARPTTWSSWSRRRTRPRAGPRWQGGGDPRPPRAAPGRPRFVPRASPPPSSRTRRPTWPSSPLRGAMRPKAPLRSNPGCTCSSSRTTSRLEDEIALKDLAARRRLLCMGPDAGTCDHQRRRARLRQRCPRHGRHRQRGRHRAAGRQQRHRAAARASRRASARAAAT